VFVKSNGILIAAFSCLGAFAMLGQTPAPAPAPAARGTGPGTQAPQDAKYAEYRAANCKNLPVAAAGGGRNARGGGGAAAGGRGGGGGGRDAAPTNPDGSPMHREYKLAAIPGVIAEGAMWKTVWTGRGNNADGPVATPDGGIMVAQNTDSKIMKLDKDNKVSFPYENTRTAGSVMINKKGVVFVLERALPQDILEVSPKRQILADKYMGEPMDCSGGLLNDGAADNKGGVYVSKGGVYYANPKGVFTMQSSVGANGIVLSPDEKTLYVTGTAGGGRGAAAAPAAERGGAGGPRGGLVAFDVQPDGSLKNERQFAICSCGDGSAVDAKGRIYSTGGMGVQVVDKDGKVLGEIPSPLPLISVAFSGPDKKTLYGIANTQQWDEIFTIPMIAQGYKGRGK
jgi:sugar lactone lactonase YvrE